MTAELSNVSNTVLVKVEDTNRDRGNRSLDSVSIQKMFIDWMDDVVFTPPSDLSATAVSDTQINLRWTDGTGESTYTVRDVSDEDTTITDVKTYIAPNTTTTSISGLIENTEYTYQVCGVDSSLSILGCSDNAKVSTDPASDITLTVDPYKVKGVNYADLTVSGVSSYNVFINDDPNPINLNVVTEGYYTDNTRQKGGMSRSYKVCDIDNSNCSTEVTVTW